MNASLFPPGSRYAMTPTAIHTTADGRNIIHLTRRFLPQPESLSLIREHQVIDGERIDNVAAVNLGDPLQYWQVADANLADDPAELTAVAGRRLRITMPQGIPGIPNV